MLAVAVPIAVLACVDGGRILELLFRAGDRTGAHAAFALLAVAAVLSIIRTFGEMVLLAEERAARYSVAVALGLVANVVVGTVAIRLASVQGAAAASLAAEVAVLVAVVLALRGRVAAAAGGASCRWCSPGLARCSPRRSPIGFRWCRLRRLCARGACWGWPSLARDGASPDGGSGPNGDDTDVREMLGGEVAGDEIEAVEYLAGPSDHL